MDMVSMTWLYMVKLMGYKAFSYRLNEPKDAQHGGFEFPHKHSPVRVSQ